MELTISQVTQNFDVTPRMLRHYEKMGLITPFHKEDYAYRCYDEEAVKRLQLIVVLRKLRIPLKKIAVILNDGGSLKTLEILRENIAELDGEIKSLETVRSALNMFVSRLDGSIQAKARLDLLGDTELMETVNTLSLSKTTLKEKTSMSDLNQANENLAKNLNVRIVLLPPFTVASNHVIGKDPEETVGDLMDKFIRESRLYEIKPDSRYFGFNHPNPGILEDGIHGYEVWATIPDDMDVPAPMVKKHFDGGLFAALTIKFPEFQYWGELENWVKNSPEYDLNYSEQGLEIMGGCLEEHLNWVYSSHMGWPENGIDGQLDLLMPIKKRDNKR
ncbi:MAG: effector binding domain-containing protein [Oscillospiraceae bacterium]|nr:effector binding domain-containing protein [Oscillospiraceae bacterium]